MKSIFDFELQLLLFESEVSTNVSIMSYCKTLASSVRGKCDECFGHD